MEIAPPVGRSPGNRLFRNELSETGKLTFRDVTEEAGVGYLGCGMGVATGDYDNDGKMDLCVTNYGRNVLYHNEGGGRFRDVSAASGIGGVPGPGLGVVTGDFNGDGWPDVHITNDGAANHLLINRRDGTFRESASRWGPRCPPTEWRAPAWE